jgi:hypothetical protein
MNNNIPSVDMLERNGIFCEEYANGNILVEVFELNGKMYKVYNYLFDAKQYVEEML